MPRRNLFNPFRINPGQEGQRHALNGEIENYTLVGNKGWLTWCKLLVGFLLAVWNGHLFISTIRGKMGVFTAAVAISLEITALYCVHNYTRSVGGHKAWLGRFAVILGGFSLVHAVIAIVDYTGYAAQTAWISAGMAFYSHVLALPIIVVLLAVTTATLSMKHWSAEVMLELADSKLESLRNRSTVLTEQHRLLDAFALSELKASLFDQETQLKVKLIPVVQRRIDAGEELEEMIKGVSDEELRRMIRAELADLTSRVSVGSLPSSQPSPPTRARSPHSRQTAFGRALQNAGGGVSNGAHF